MFLRSLGTVGSVLPDDAVDVLARLGRGGFLLKMEVPGGGRVLGGSVRGREGSESLELSHITENTCKSLLHTQIYIIIDLFTL